MQRNLSTKRTPYAVALLAGVLWLPTLVSAGPTSKGTEVTGGAGAGAYEWEQTTGCNGPTHRHRADQKLLMASMSHKAENGVTAKANAQGFTEEVKTSTLVDCGNPESGVTCTDAPDVRVGDTNQGFASSFRVGFEGEWGGVDIGPAWFLALDAHTVLPSVSGWLGAEEFHVFGDLLSADSLLGIQVLRLGVGHRSEHVRLGLETEVFFTTFSSGSAVALRADIKVGPKVWLGAKGGWTGEVLGGGQLRLTYEWD